MIIEVLCNLMTERIELDQTPVPQDFLISYVLLALIKPLNGPSDIPLTIIYS